ncbi:MAG: Hpt domain-containing protein [Lachnospiraceae bacterium]|nr:Hpt domain-containing protein [Lachnospiraceae bacterium]
MTVKECYEQIGSDYAGVLKRLSSEALVKRFALKFLKDPSYQELKDALARQDGEVAFRAAHTLKGVCLNLGFDRLYESSAALTELLRGRDCTGYEPLFDEVSVRYEALTAALKELEAQG